jgi:type II secretory pathway component GspD/PulD (secretin)
MLTSSNRAVITVVAGIVLAAFLCAATSEAATLQQKLEGVKYREYKEFHCDYANKPFGDIAREFQKYSDLNILPGSFKDVPVTLNIPTDVSWQEAFEIILQMINADIVVRGEKTIEVVPSTKLFIQDGNLATAIIELARGNGKNVIIDPDVKGTISVNLEGVSFEDSLNALAEAGGYKVVKISDNLYRVASPEKLTRQLVTKRITLKYLWPDAPYRAVMDSQTALGPDPKAKYKPDDPLHQPEETFTVLKALKKMLTADPANPDKFIGHIEYIPPTNTLVITDVKPKVDEITNILNEIDRAPYQVMIDVKFVTTTNTDFFEFGVDLVNGIRASASGASTFIRFPFAKGRSWFANNMSAFDKGTNGKYAGGAGIGGGSIPGLFIDPNQDGTADRLPYTFGTLDFSQLKATLRMMKNDVGTEILQRPQILTLNNKEATIFVGNRVRFAQTVAASSQQGTLQFSIEEAQSSPVDTGFQLLILPRVIEGAVDENGKKQPDKIMMTVMPESRALVGTTSEVPGFNKFVTGTGTGQEISIDLPEVATSSLVTNMILKSNQTAVIGGLITDTDVESVRQVPFLGRIPILGYLFKSKSHDIRKSNLLIFITPRIVYSDSDVESILAKELHKNRQNLPKKYPDDAGIPRKYDIEDVYNKLYGKPNPYDAWREYDDMPKKGAAPAEGKEVKPAEPVAPKSEKTEPLPPAGKAAPAAETKPVTPDKPATEPSYAPETPDQPADKTAAPGNKEAAPQDKEGGSTPDNPPATDEKSGGINQPLPEQEKDKGDNQSSEKENFSQLEGKN